MSNVVTSPSIGYACTADLVQATLARMHGATTSYSLIYLIPHS